ncbi:MAG: response regulator transcription factor [Akkermansiaceae bacterium]|nr:response regulator transcription factor [Armatimonadota bacterium]
MIRAAVVEDEPLARQFLATLLEDTGLVSVIGQAGEATEGLTLCGRERPQVVFLDIRMPGPDGMVLGSRLTALPDPPFLVFVTGYAERAHEAFRLEAIDYLLKPLDADRVAEAVSRIARRLAPPADIVTKSAQSPSPPLALAGSEHLPVKHGNGDVIKLLARGQIVAALRRDRRTFIHTVGEEFATYYPLAQLAEWLGTPPFVMIARDAVVNLNGVREIIHYGDRLYQVCLRDRADTRVEASRSGAARLAALLRSPF